MKKYYFFAALATVGLFASCSSDEDFNEAAGARQLTIDENSPAKIEIGIADNYEISRGTGRVGDINGAANAQWAGQEFSVLMLEKNTMMGAYMDPADPTSVIFKGTKMTATGTTVVSLDPDARYYPNFKQDGISTGIYDFWGYRLDDSAILSGGEEQFVGYDVAATNAEYTWIAYSGNDAATLTGTADPTTATVGAVGDIYENTASGDKFECTVANPGNTAANQITVPFKINGTQDIMIAETNPSDAAYATANPTVIYSAKSARNGVKPTMAFKHLLTSLTFKVKPKSRDISDQATNPTTDPKWKAGYQIMNITLKSKATGDLIVAFTPDNVVADEDRIVWTAGQKWDDVTTLTAFQLQCRPKAINDAADIKMVAVSSNAVTGFDVNYPAGYVDMSGASKYTVGADLLTMTVYDSNLLYDGTGETGLPKGNATTLGAMKTAAGADVTGYILTYNATDRSAGEYETTAKQYECDYKTTAAAITDNLAPFYENADVYKTVLDWEGYSAGAAETPVVVANEAAGVVGDYTGAATDHKFDGSDPTAAGYLTLAQWKNTLPVGTGYVYFDGTNYTKFDITTAYAAAVPAADGAAQATLIGEPMLVAPSNDAANSGYQVIVRYKYWKKKKSDEVVSTEVDSKPITVNNYTIDPASGNKILSAFEAGKNYNVTITLYSDGEVLNGDASSDPWDNGGDIDAGEDD